MNVVLSTGGGVTGVGEDVFLQLPKPVTVKKRNRAIRVNTSNNLVKQGTTKVGRRVLLLHSTLQFLIAGILLQVRVVVDVKLRNRQKFVFTGFKIGKSLVA